MCSTRAKADHFRAEGGDFGALSILRQGVGPASDAPDDPLHGHQEGRFFHGYYDCYCYLPLYIFCGRHLLAAKLRPANIDASAESVDEVARIVAQIRACWPKTRIILRADSGFARDALMRWCEANGVDFIFGLAKNLRLIRAIGAELMEAQEESRTSEQPARRFKELVWRTRKSWSQERRVVAKAEWTQGAANPRFIVTSLTAACVEGRTLYEQVYCARGERIKECQLDLFADRTSAWSMKANQLRLWFASMAYVLVSSLRRIGLQQTGMAEATCGTIRRKLFKIGALVTIGVRRIKLAVASGCPIQGNVFRRTSGPHGCPQHQLSRKPVPTSTMEVPRSPWRASMFPQSANHQTRDSRAASPIVARPPKPRTIGLQPTSRAQTAEI